MRPPSWVVFLYDILDRLRRFLIISIFSFIILAGAMEIFLRFTPGMKSFSWSDEIMRYLNIWVIFLGAGLAVRTNGHMAMDYFLKRSVPERALPYIRKMTLAIICIALIALGVVGLLKTISTIDVVIQAFDVPIALFYAAIPVGCFLMVAEYALILVFGDESFTAYGEKN